MLKKLFLVVIFLFAIQPLAFADHHLVFVSQVVKIDDASCAIELTISANNQDAFQTTDVVTLDGVVVDNLENVVGLGINEDSGHNDSGDHILFGSATFGETVLEADGGFSDDVCADLTNTSEVCFVIDDDSDGTAETEIDCLDLAEVEGFADNTAAVKSSTSADPVLLDLTTEDVEFTDNSGETETVGASDDIGDDDSASSSSCALRSNTQTAPNHFFVLFLGASFVFLMNLRRKMSRSSV